MTDDRRAAAVVGGPSAVVIWVLRVVVIGLFIAWSATHLDGFSWDYDEGIHVYIAWLVQQGHPLYAQTFSPYTPGLISALTGAFALFGATIYTARMVTVMLAALGMFGVMVAASELIPSPARRGWGRLLAELFAALLLALTPSFFQWSRAAMSDLPSAALTALAVALALIYLRDQRLRWLFASELVFAFALWVKLISIGGAAAIALAMVLVLRERRSDIQRALAGSLLVGILALLPLLLFDVRGLYEQAIYFHVQKRAVYEYSLAENFFVLVDFLSQNLMLASLAVLGAFTGLLNRATYHRSLITLVWFVATFVSLMLQTPLFANHHPVVLVCALAALAGAGVALASGELRIAISSLPDRVSLSPRLLVTLPALFLALSGLTQLPDQLRAVAEPSFQPVAEEAVALLAALTPPDDLLVSDAQMIAFRARRQSPPALADTSHARIDSDNLTAAQLISITQQSNANAILFWGVRLSSTQSFVNWAEQNYYPVRSAFQKPNSPYRLLLRTPHPQNVLDAQIGDGMKLLGYDLNRRLDAPITPVQALSLTLYFQRTGAIAHSYTIFTHLLGADGRVVAQADRPPLAGRYPTDQWRADEFIADEFVMPLNADVSDGEYQLEVGMYLRETLQRLPVTIAGVQQTDDRLLLKSISIRMR